MIYNAQTRKPSGMKYFDKIFTGTINTFTAMI